MAEEQASTARPRLIPALETECGYRRLAADEEKQLLDRYSDPDSPVRGAAGLIGTYRAQELFTFQVAEAMVRAVRQTRAGPVSAAPVDFAIVTGNATDNCQQNELRSYITLLDGGEVVPDSGKLDQYEGVAGPQVEDERYWHPEGGPQDLPRTTYGFPEVAGVLTAQRHSRRRVAAQPRAHPPGPVLT
jgi:3',5'-cyclic AMP phosphodiesterase CpdA